MKKLHYVLLITGPPYGTQNASAALQFCLALLKRGHYLHSLFFYREGVFNANALTSPAGDECDLIKKWSLLHHKYGVPLHVCVSAALRRGISNKEEAHNLALMGENLHPDFLFVGLGALTEAALVCDRVIQF